MGGMMLRGFDDEDAVRDCKSILKNVRRHN